MHGEMLYEGVGSRYYMAPEVISQSNYDFRADVWSAMVVLYTLITGEMPFYAENFSDMLNSIYDRDLGIELDSPDLQA